jgi:flagellin FlaB
MHSQRGMTGLETAIILISFVTVAAVFGYAVLSAGLFSAERSKETIYAGLKQARANMEVSGSVIVESADPDATVNAQIDIIRVTVRNAIAGTPVDMTPPTYLDHPADSEWGNNRCVISLTTEDAYYNNIAWEVEYIGAHDPDNLLDQGEQLELTITLLGLKNADGVPYDGTGGLPDTPSLGTNHWFNIQVKPVMGSTMTIQRTLPAGLERVMDLH